MFSLLVLRLCRLNLVLLSMVMVHLPPSSMLLTSILSLCHCPLVLEIILQPGVRRQVDYSHPNQVPTVEQRSSSRWNLRGALVTVLISLFFFFLGKDFRKQGGEAGGSQQETTGECKIKTAVSAYFACLICGFPHQDESLKHCSQCGSQRFFTFSTKA